MRMTKLNNEVYPSTTIRGSYSFKFLTPDGNATIFISEKEIGKIERIDYFIGKAGSSVAAWSHALIEFINFAFDKNIPLNDVINKISNITTGMNVRSISGIKCKSGPDAIFLALMKYRGMSNRNNIPYVKPRIRKR